MRLKILLWPVATLTLLLTAACSDSNNNDSVTGEGAILALHAISDVGSVSFLIEETFLSSISYKQNSGTTQFDDLKYTFRFDILLPDDTETTTLVSATQKVDADFEYTFVLTGSLDEPELVIWDQFGRDWGDEITTATDNDTTVTVMEVAFGHLSTEVGLVDVYLEAPGTSPLSTLPKTTIGYADYKTAIELPAGDYQLVLTPSGDPSTILFAADAVAIPAATTTKFVIMNDGGETTADYSVRWMGTGVGTDLFDIDLQSELSIIHAAQGTGAVDVFSGGALVDPLIQNLNFSEISPAIRLPPGTLNVNVTPSNNPGVFLEERALSINSGETNRMFLVGFPGDLQALLFTEDRRSIATHAKFQFLQAATRFPTVDVYIVSPDVDVTLIGPTYSSILYGTSSGSRTYLPGDYNMFVTEAGTNNVIGGPYLLSLEPGDIHGAVILDSPSITATDIMMYDLASDI